MTTLYRPSNGTEGELFYEEFCAKCVRDQNEDCPIYTATMVFGVDDPQYPKEWIEDEAGPRCTAFDEIVHPDTPTAAESAAQLPLI